MGADGGQLARLMIQPRHSLQDRNKLVEPYVCAWEVRSQGLPLASNKENVAFRDSAAIDNLNHHDHMPLFAIEHQAAMLNIS